MVNAIESFNLIGTVFALTDQLEISTVLSKLKRGELNEK